jgi:hypothetical protein
MASPPAAGVAKSYTFHSLWSKQLTNRDRHNCRFARVPAYPGSASLSSDMQLFGLLGEDRLHDCMVGLFAEGLTRQHLCQIEVECNSVGTSTFARLEVIR